MGRKHRMLALILVMLLFLCTGCGGGGGTTKTTPHKTKTTVLMPKATGTTVYRGTTGEATMDASNSSEGYVMVKYTGGADKVQVHVTDPSGTKSPYPFRKNRWEAVTMTGGDGEYKVEVLGHVSGNRYALVLSQKINVKLKDGNKPFLFPNQYVDYKPGALAVKKAREVSKKAESSLDFVKDVYNYIIENIRYDEAFAKNIPLNYLPDPDRTLRSKKGICLDYAALTSTMLRSQGIPTKLEVGYSGTTYHAWISVYLEDIGWVENVIQFEGKKWTLIDPTLAAENDGEAAGEYMREKDNYTVKYTY